MKYLYLTLSAMALAACGNPMQDYSTMTLEQKEVFMANYEKDMRKVHSLANRMGKMNVVYETDARNDRITSRMTMDMDLKGGGGQAMANQVSAMMLEQNCKEKFIRDFVEAGITFRMVMKDKSNRTIVDTVVSPTKCAKYLS